jgi:hypothetical protein
MSGGFLVVSAASLYLCKRKRTHRGVGTDRDTHQITLKTESAAPADGGPHKAARPKP